MQRSGRPAPGGAGLLMVLVDALRWDYPERIPYLRELSARSTTGRLVEPFGFTPRAAYFSGVDVEPGGFTHMFEWNPESSPFSAARFMPALPEGTAAAARVRDALRERGRSLASDFASRYVDPAHIPLEYLRFFDVAEQKCPWGPDRPSGSLFDLLRSHDKRAYTCAWPATSGMSDAAIVARTLHELKGDTRFAFIHLSNLDAVGHLHGPGSPELQVALEGTDTHVRALVDHARSIWRYPRVLLFGDHGMVQVVRTIDVRPAIESAGLSFGRDFGYFIDSTTIRFWYFRADARCRIRSAVATIVGGHFLTDDERTSFGLDRAGWRNGEDFFLASPGILFSPSFFGAAPLKGMHGYDPGCRDNQGAFIYWTPSDETPRDAGAIRAARLFPTALAACDVPLPRGVPQAVSTGSSQPRKPNWTFTAPPHHEAIVERDMQRITDRILFAVPDCDAIILAGSFGRGEGVVRDQPEPSAVNDYDVMVVGGRPREDIGAVREELERGCSVDAIDLAWTDPARAAGASQFGFDLRYGSRVLYGHASVLDRQGPSASAQLTMADAWLGLSNRACGLLEVVHSDATGRAVRLQLTKFAVAVGDAYLILFGDYHARHAVRAVRFADLANAAGVPHEIVRAVSAGYQRKLGLDSAGDGQIEVEDLLTAAADLARRNGEVPGVAAHAASQAVEGRRRQTPALRGEDPHLPPAFAADLADIYQAGWRLLQNLALDPEWHAERDRLIARWRKVIH